MMARAGLHSITVRSSNKKRRYGIMATGQACGTSKP